MKNLYLCLSLVSLLFAAACGTGNGFVTGFVPKGNFSNASLKGQYVYQIEGFDFGGNLGGVAYREAGVFAADGNGALTSVTDDFSEGSNLLKTVSTGSYTINVDGTGSLTFRNPLGPVNMVITLVSASKVYVVEGDALLNAGGLAEKQDANAIASAPAGTFVFREHDLNTVQSVARVGAFTVAGGIVSNGNEDLNSGGTFSSRTFTGSLNAPDSSIGRGQGTFTDNSPATSTFIYYIVDANNIRFLSSDVAVQGLGRAELQNGVPTLSGNYAFGSRGDTDILGGVNMAGRFSASAGNITAGARDAVQVSSSNRSNPTNVSFTGTYASSGGGRVLASLSTAANSNLVIWMVSPARGLFLVNDPDTVQDGSLDLQQLSSFSNSTMNGQFGFVMDGFDASGVSAVDKDRVGTLQWDGAGKLTLNEFANTAGSPNQVVLSGNYAVSANGRTGASIGSLSSNLIFYLVSGNDAYTVQNDPGVLINGTISKQQ